MSFSFHFSVDTSPSNASSSERNPVVGTLKLGNSPNGNSSPSEGQVENQEIQISLDHKLFRETSSRKKLKDGDSMKIIDFKLDDIWEGIGKLKFKKQEDGNFQYLNPNRKATERIIFHGFYENDIPVAIERIQKNTSDQEKKRAVYVLRRLHIHENFIRYFSYETDSYFNYIATELCLCSVADLFDPENVKKVNQDGILDSLTAKGILYQATRGLEYLHQNGIVHRNIKPSSFLIKEIKLKPSSSDKQTNSKYVVKISDFRLAREMDDTNHSGTVAREGWIAPESKDTSKLLKASMDVFIHGCFFYYVLSGFENEKEENRMLTSKFNVEDESCAIYKEEWNPKNIGNDEKALKLIKKMIKFNEGDRPTSSEVLQDDYFKSGSSTKEYYSLYDGNNSKPGLCVIFNQEIFHKSKEREGSDKDWKELERTFKSLGFDVIIYHDLTMAQLIAEMDLLTEDKYENCGCLVICLLSHGIENAIACADEQLVNINELQYKFVYEFCPSLYGKPKIFIVQACQGDRIQNNTGIINSSLWKWISEMNKKSNDHLSEKKRKMDNLDRSNLASIPFNGNPPISDLIAIKSTIPGFASFRFLDGSPFIQALCQKLQDEYIFKDDFEKAHDLESILRGEGGVQSLVNRRLRNGDKQSIRWECSSLSKHIKFRKIHELQEPVSGPEHRAVSKAKFSFSWSLIICLSILVLVIAFVLSFFLSV